ncbi:phosphopantothenoylcysteine decarboxylase [Puniceicoccales bacterium CK1056]|uniref:Phosphopantothenoylcysteine decarboxylase n=1 Tax=Oceanipulchritudo coccoides TaxID=2706888 RepID=A0A6B2M3L4_9BACT|nr:phosphopantothenoylcysteine decarboxylase [Oceanipulchritudo coccoides]NDV62677.1 phosphopantothenoylcysteine decarboxylase [Oceanipulchritudo coccoides]
MNASPIRCLVSAGPTREHFDPVRFLSNPSSGKMGYALASAASKRGWHVDLVSGPVSLPVPEGVELTRVVTGQEMYNAVSERFDACDILIMTAAIMDYRPKSIADHKIKKFELEMLIEMEPVIDVLATVARRKINQLIVGFAAETDHLEEYATKKLENKKADFVVANLIGGPAGAFEKDSNKVLVLRKNGQTIALGPLTKVALAGELLDLFEPELIRKVASKSADPGGTNAEAS